MVDPPVASKNASVSTIKPSVAVTYKTYSSHAYNTSAWQKYIHHYRLPGNKSKSVFLFVVNFHFPFYDKVGFILNTYFVKFRKLYIKDFDVILVGPKEDKAKRVISNGLPGKGYYSYHTLSLVYNQLCLKEKCFYDGFFLMNDDSCIDPRFLSAYDLSQSWNEPYESVNYSVYWYWYKIKNEEGITFRRSYEKSIKMLLKTKDGKECDLANRSNWKKGYSDAFYIVAADMPRWYRMMLIMKKYYVFLEMAVPTVNWCLTKNEFIDCNHGAMLDRLTCVHMHPVKYRQPNMMKLCLQRMDHLNMKDTPPRRY